MMHMSFWWGSDVGDFLIKGLTVNSTLSLVALCFCLFVLSIGVEAMKVSSNNMFFFPYLSSQIMH